MTFTPTATAVPTFTPRGTELNPAPVEINVGLPGIPNGNPYGVIQDGYYVILDLISSPIVVTYPPDANYDFVYYERSNPVDIQMDTIVMGISMDGINFYEVFNWYNGIPDYNSNIWDVAKVFGESDNQPIFASNLYGTTPYQTGILIDVDNAPSYPPAGSYQYLILEVPAGSSSTDAGTDVDAIQIIEVPLPP